MTYQLPEEMKQLKLLARDFVQKELVPLEKEVDDKDEFPEETRLALKKKAHELGLWSFTAPIEYGGSGLGSLARVVVSEEVGKVSEAVGYGGGIVGGGMEMRLRVAVTNEKLREKYYLPYVRAEKECFMGLTEPNAGSDAGAIETRAVRDGENYILNGTKTFISNAQRADFGLVYAVTDWEKRARGGISCFLVDKDTPGLSITRNIPLMGRRGQRHAELSFVDCVVPADNMLGEEGQGLRLALAALGGGRVSLAGFAIGGAERCLEMAKSYLKQRATFGKELAHRQAMQTMIVEMAIDIHAAKLMVYDCASAVDRGEDTRLESAMVKVFATEMAFKAADRTLQIHGGIGYSKDLPLEMLFRDLRLRRIVDGPTELLNWYMARQILDMRLE